MKLADDNDAPLVPVPTFTAVTVAMYTAFGVNPDRVADVEVVGIFDNVIGVAAPNVEEVHTTLKLAGATVDPT